MPLLPCSRFRPRLTRSPSTATRASPGARTPCRTGSFPDFRGMSCRWILPLPPREDSTSVVSGKPGTVYTQTTLGMVDRSPGAEGAV